MLGRDEQAADIQAERSEVLEGKVADDQSSGSDDINRADVDGKGGVPGEMPEGKSGGDMKPDGL